MQIKVIKSSKKSVIMGHGVIFNIKHQKQKEAVEVAFIDGYDWLHKNPEIVEVYLFDIDEEVVKKTGMATYDIIKETLTCIKYFLSSKGRVKRRGKISTWWNA